MEINPYGFAFFTGPVKITFTEEHKENDKI